jgi:orotate phosphoribosyltransferase-like protein
LSGQNPKAPGFAGGYLLPSGNHEEYDGGNDEADCVFHDIIEPGVRSALGPDVDLIREIDTRKSGAITSNIVRNIARADVVIVDITGYNPNVFFELGIRYALRRNGTIIMRQAKSTPIPFDINVYRMIDYSPFRRDEAVQHLSSYISKVLIAPEHERATDSLVYDVLRSMQVHFNEAFDGEDVAPPMPWSTYWARLARIAGKLREASVEGHYKPDALIGITNGGAIFADLLGREVGYRCPILSLWANRAMTDYFHNPINDAICQGIVDYLKKTDPKITKPKLLLVDDIVASGHTYRHAINYLRGRVLDRTPPLRHEYYAHSDSASGNG